MAKTGKRLKKAYEGLDPAAPPVKLEDAVKQIKSRAAAKFDETVEIAMNLNLDPRKPDQNLRGTVMLPHGTGKSVRVAVFARGDRAKEAEAAGADIVGAEDLAEKVQAGQIDFDRGHRDAGHDGGGRPAREDLGAARADAEPASRHSNAERDRGRPGGQRRPGRVPRREGRDRPCRCWQSELYGGRARR